MKKPSISELLDLLAKPALIGWANKQGLKGIDIEKTRRASLSGGTSMHKQIEDYCLGNGDFERDIDRMQFRKMMENKKIISIEKEIETEYFIGRYDAKIDVEGEEYIVDYKTGFSGRVYLENKLQLVAYTMADPAKIAIVGCPQFEFVPVKLENRAYYEDMLISLSRIYIAKKLACE